MNVIWCVINYTRSQSQLKIAEKTTKPGSEEKLRQSTLEYVLLSLLENMPRCYHQDVGNR
jgi:hypothetical protein